MRKQKLNRQEKNLYLKNKYYIGGLKNVGSKWDTWIWRIKF